MATRRGRQACLVVAAALLSASAGARPRLNGPETLYDSGVVSAETLGRGGTIASNRATPASGSENPASLSQPAGSGSLYTTTLLSTRSHLPAPAEDATDPLGGKTLQYLAVQADKGVLFFEPVSRFSQTLDVDPAAGTTRDLDVQTNALGFAGAQKLGPNGAYGLSIAYLWSSIMETDRSGATITETKHDTMDGLRLNLGVRYPTGPAMWGAVIQNAPAFLWGSTYKAERPPLRARVGNTFRLSKGVLFSVDGERRFYRDGGDHEDVVYLGNETFLSDNLVARVGAFGTSLNTSDKRHLTAGVSASAKNGTTLSYAFETFRADDETVRRHLLSVQVAFTAGD
jgi:hypothetical protein